MSKYINSNDIINLINNGKFQLITDAYQFLLNEEYGLDQKDLNLEYLRILIKSLEYEFQIDPHSDITYDLYNRLTKLVNKYNIPSYNIDITLQQSYINYIYVVGEGGSGKAEWGFITGTITDQLDLINLLKAPSWTVYGPVPFGKYSQSEIVPENTNVFEQIKEAYQDVPQPNYIAPVSLLTSNQSTILREVGESVANSFVVTFTQNDAGLETGRVINKNGSPLSGTTDTITLSTNDINYQAVISYSQGPIKNNVAGEPDDRGRIMAGTVSSNVLSYKGTYPIYATTSSITTLTKQPLVDSSSSNYIQITLISESGGNKQKFEIANPWLASRPLTSVQYFNSLSGQFETVNKIGDFLTSSVTETVGGNSVNYTRYTYTGSDRGDLLIRLIF